MPFRLFVAVVVTICTMPACDQSPHGTSSLQDIDDVMTMQVREDGRYDVICEDGSREIVTDADIRANDACPNSSNNEPTHIVSVQRRADGLFAVICDDLSHLTVTGAELVSGDVCAPDASVFQRLCEARSSGSREYQASFDYVLGEILAEEDCRAAATKALSVKQIELWKWHLHPDLSPFAALPRLETLTLHPLHDSAMPDFASFASHPRLRKVVLRAHGFAAEIAKIQGLRSLDASQLGDDWPLTDLDLLPQLEELFLQIDVADQSVEPLARLENLKILNINGIWGGSTIYLPDLRSFSKLESLTLSHSYAPNSEQYAVRIGLDAFQETSTLKHLEVDFLAPQAISKIASLESLSLQDWDASTIDLTPLRKLRRLKRVDLKNVPQYAFSAVLELAETAPIRALSLGLREPLDLAGLDTLQALEDLEIRYIHLENQTADLTKISQLPRLTSLRVIGADDFVHVDLGNRDFSSTLSTFSCNYCTLTNPAQLSVLTHLESLFLYQMPYVDLAFLKAPERLKWLGVRSVKEIRNADVLRFATRAEHLDFGYSSPMASLDFLATMTNLRDLEIEVTDAQSTRAISALPQLERLVINALDPTLALDGLNKLRILFVDGPFHQSIVGAGLRLPFLRSIDIRAAQPQITGLDLRGLPRLQGLYLSQVENLADFPDLAQIPQVSDIRILHSAISHVPSLLGSYIRNLELGQSNVRELNFDAGDLRDLRIYDLHKISREFIAPRLDHLSASFESGIPITPEICPLDHTSPGVARFCQIVTESRD